MLLTAVVALVTLSASAQVYLGGEVGLWRNPDANKTQFNLRPDVGYTLSDNWALGVALQYNYTYVHGAKINSMGVNPYVRYNVAKFGPVNVFLDGGFEFNSVKVKGADSANEWGVGIKPGLAVNLTDKLSFVTHLGFLGYNDMDEGEFVGDHGAGGFWGIDDEHGFGFHFSKYCVFGLYYNF